jgi:hypothetical protein
MSVSCLVSWVIERGPDDEARDSPVDVPEILEDGVPALLRLVDRAALGVGPQRERPGIYLGVGGLGHGFSEHVPCAPRHEVLRPGMGSKDTLKCVGLRRATRARNTAS